MNWLSKWVQKQAHLAWNNATSDEKMYDSHLKHQTMGAISANPSRKLDREPTLNFRLHHAENGWIVEVTNYDQRTDRHVSKMHLIGDDQDFDTSICQIITLEALKG